MISLETVLGTTKTVNPNGVIANRVENIKNTEANGPLLTANFVRNIWTEEGSNGYGSGEEISKYVVINRPENIGQLLMEKYGKDEWELASVYVMEEKERVEQHNNRERQKIGDWEKENKRLIAQWEERERRRIPDWEERERNRREEYDLETAIRQEDAERASLSPAELVFNALENKGIQIGAIRTRYQHQGYLSPLRQGWLRKFLSGQGIQDNTVIEDIVNLTNSRNPVLKEGLREILVNQLGVEFPEVKPKEPLPPYEPAPYPKPEPRPIPNPRPEIRLKEVPPLLGELEAVVMDHYNGQSLESLKLTSEAWNAAGIRPQEVRDRMTKDVIPLTDQYLLVRVVGKSGEDSGNLNLLQISSNRPSVLKPYFITPSQAAFDAYVLAANIHRAINDYFKEDEKGKNIISQISIEKQPFLKRAIVEETLNRTTPLASAMFPNSYAVVIAEEEPMKVRTFRETQRFNGALYLLQRWYASNVTQEELQQYRTIAADIIPEIKDRFAREQFGVISGDRKTQKEINDLGKIIDVVRSLADAVPGEYFELMEENKFVTYADDVRSKLRRIAQEGKILKPAEELLCTMRLELGENYKKRIPELESKLGRFLMKGINQWQMEFSNPVMASTLLKYNIGTTVDFAYSTKTS